MMQRFSLLLFMAIIFSGVLPAQTKQQTAVATAVEALRKAMVDADKGVLEKLTHDSLSYGHSGGNVENKALFVENIMNGNSDFLSIDLTEQTICIAGKTAIVRHKLSAGTNNKGAGPGTVKLAVLTVWQEGNKEWKLLARQAVKVQ